MSIRLDIKRSGSLMNYFSNVVRSRFKWFWRFIGMFPWISDLSTIVLLRAMEKTIPRIPDQTTHHDYKTYDGLYDESRTVHALLLPKMSKAKTSKLPDVDEVKELFRRKEFKPEDHRQSSVFFPFWAQWFVHQFFNSSTEVPGTPQWQTGFNLSQLYGSFTHEKDMRTFNKGRIKTESVNGEEYPRTTENQFKGYKIAGHQAFMGDKVFDVPVMPFNALPGIMAIHTVMIRNHNRNAERLATAYPRMDDEEIFQKAKLISIAQVMKVTMEDYVNKHILASNVEIRFRPNLLKTRHWRYLKPASFMPSNSISSEFNFLYRWHQLLPDTIQLIEDYDPQRRYTSLEGLKTRTVDVLGPVHDVIGNVGRYLTSASLQHAGKICLRNTKSQLVDMVIGPGLKKSRDIGVSSYNDYRELFGFARMESFSEITDDPELADEMSRIYKGNVDAIDYYAGIFAEEKMFGGLHGPLLSFMGVGLTYTGVFTSRMLRPEVFHEGTFSKEGMKILEETTSAADIVRWNTGGAWTSFHLREGEVIR